MSITLDLPEKTETALAEALREEGVTPDVLIANAIDDYLFLRKFRRLREKMLAQAPFNLTDEDVFEVVS